MANEDARAQAPDDEARVDDEAEAEVDRIFDEATDASKAYWRGSIPPNPYPPNSWQHDTYACAFRNAYASENH